MTVRFRKAVLAASLLATVASLAAAMIVEPASARDRPEPGLQGQTMPGEAVVLARPYSKGVRRIGHDPIRGRDTNVQLAWVDQCAYVSSTAGPFPIIGALKGDPALTGVAVIDVRNPISTGSVSIAPSRRSMRSNQPFNHAVVSVRHAN